MSEYRDELAALAEEHGILEEQRAMFMLGIACGWLEAKDRHLEATRGLGLAGRGALGVDPPSAPGEPQRSLHTRWAGRDGTRIYDAPPLGSREAHSHAERGAR